MTGRRSGFTIVELVVAIMVLTVGLLAMLGSSALDSRAIMRERNIDLASIYASRRLELLRVNGCRHPVDSTEMFMSGGDSLATNTWTFTATRDPFNVVDGYRLRVLSRYFKAPTGTYGDARARNVITRRTDTLEAAITC